MEIWEPKPPGTLWATPGLLRDSFAFYCISRECLGFYIYIHVKRIHVTPIAACHSLVSPMKWKVTGEPVTKFQIALISARQREETVASSLRLLEVLSRNTVTRPMVRKPKPFLKHYMDYRNLMVLRAISCEHKRGQRSHCGSERTVQTGGDYSLW